MGKPFLLNTRYGYETLYGHLSKVKVEDGQEVKAGDKIGYAGSTGRSTGPHLHYEVIKNGKNLDPMKYLFLR
ncbi:MAG: M23 family metallopeptidase [Deltaproteobacteria bacterium]|nr:M23 family metallopeptidase [Deltaproteobacteria bacterium]